jgi:hypothetical protein
MHLALAGAAAAQSGDTVSSATYDSALARVRSVRIAPSPLYLSVGDTAAVSVSLLDSVGKPVTVTLPSGTRIPPTYYLTSPGFMFLDSYGNVTFGGQDAPSSTLHIVGHMPSRSAKVMVQDGPPGKYRTFEVPIVVKERDSRRIELERPPYPAMVGSSLQLFATVWKSGVQYPDPAPDLVWSSSAPRVASVSGNGTVTLQRPGVATISAANGGARASVRLVVEPSRATRITLTPDHASVPTGNVVHLNPKAFDAGGHPLPGARPALVVNGGAGVFDRCSVMCPGRR